MPAKDNMLYCCHQKGCNVKLIIGPQMSGAMTYGRPDVVISVAVPPRIGCQQRPDEEYLSLTRYPCILSTSIVVLSIEAES